METADKLKNREYYIVVDRSSSMEENDTPTKQSRWDYAKETVFALATKLQEFDPDGPTLLMFGNQVQAYPNTTAEKVHEAWAKTNPAGGTMLAPALQWCFDDFLKAKSAGTAKENGAIAIVITDGQPGDGQQAARAIRDFTKKLESREEFGISFFQIGKANDATKYLKRLDDDLQAEGAKHDIVDAKTQDELGNTSLVEAIQAALVD